MSITAHVHQIYIHADAASVRAGITDSEWTRRHFHTTSFVEPPVAGRRTVTADGRDAIEGVVEELSPPAPGHPGARGGSCTAGTCSTTPRWRSSTHPTAGRTATRPSCATRTPRRRSC